MTKERREYLEIVVAWLVGLGVLVFGTVWCLRTGMFLAVAVLTDSSVELIAILAGIGTPWLAVVAGCFTFVFLRRLEEDALSKQKGILFSVAGATVFTALFGLALVLAGRGDQKYTQYSQGFWQALYSPRVVSTDCLQAFASTHGHRHALPTEEEWKAFAMTKREARAIFTCYEAQQVK